LSVLSDPSRFNGILALERGDTIPQDYELTGLKHIAKLLQKLLDSSLFSIENAEESFLALRQAEEGHTRAILRIKIELLEDAHVMMATIGSSHKLPVPIDDDDADMVDAFDRLHIGTAKGKETIVVFDEAGCIPDYELLGLSRLKRSIKALICVGDKHQLPPYAPSSFGRRASGPPSRDEKVDSLLDVSGLVDDGDTGGQIRLNTQYRVPRDIANVLNDRIYKGNYRTAINCDVPNRGFHFVDVNYLHGGKKYENENASSLLNEKSQKRETKVSRS